MKLTMQRGAWEERFARELMRLRPQTPMSHALTFAENRYDDARENGDDPDLSPEMAAADFCKTNHRW